MADPTTIVTGHLNRDVDKDAVILVVKNAEPLVIGGLAAMAEATGNVEFADDTAGLLPVGVVAEGKYGNNDTLTGNVGGTVSVKSRGGAIIKSVTVTGVASIADISKYVYATDGQTMSLTPTAEELPIGVVTAYIDRNIADVYLFNMIESRTNVGVMGVVNAIDETTGVADAGKIIKTRSDGLLDDSFLVPEVVLESELIGSTVGVADANKPIKTDATGKLHKSFLPDNLDAAYISFGTFPARSLRVNAAISMHVALRDMTIVSFHAQIRGGDAGMGSGSSTVAISVAGVPTTGGVVSLAFGDFNFNPGAVKDGTAITGGNNVTAGQALTAVSSTIDAAWSDCPGATFEIYALVNYT